MSRDSDWIDPYYTQQYSSNAAPYQGPYYNPQQNLQYRAPYNQPIGRSQYEDAYGGIAATSGSTVNAGADREALQRGATMRTFLTGDGARTKPSFQSSESSSTAVSGHLRSESTASLVKLQQKDKERMGARCLRFTGCTILIFLYLAICTFLTLALYVRPPSLTVGQLGVNTTNPLSTPPGGGISVNLGMNFSVINPNYFSVNFKKIQADIKYPIKSTRIGQGSINDVVFESHSSKDFTFPLAFTYSSAIDPGDMIINDLEARCRGGKEIDVDATLTLGIRILFVTISPSFDKSFSFPCPGPLASVLSGNSSGIFKLQF